MAPQGQLLGHGHAQWHLPSRAGAPTSEAIITGVHEATVVILDSFYATRMFPNFSFRFTVVALPKEEY